jgi:2-keto-myo-inositol isomerase
MNIPRLNHRKLQISMKPFPANAGSKAACHLASVLTLFSAGVRIDAAVTRGRESFSWGGKKLSRRHFQPALNLVTLMRADLVEAIVAAADAGFEHIELWVDSLEKYLEKHTVDDLRQLLEKYHLHVLSIGDIESITFCTAEQFAQVRAQCERFAAVAQEIHCPTLIISGSVKPKGATPVAIADEVHSVLAQLLDVVEPHGVGLALAFRGFPWCSIDTLDQAVQAVKAFDNRKIGLALDTFDLYLTGCEEQALSAIDPGKIFILRLSDCADVQPALLTDTARAMPGEGKADLSVMLDALGRSGFSGPISVKVFSPRLLNMDAAEIAKQAMAAVEPFSADKDDAKKSGG